MNKIILIFLLSFTVTACRSVPKRNLTTKEGAVAAHFSVPEKEVKDLTDRGYSLKQSVGILFISNTTYLNKKEVVEKMQEGNSLNVIASDAGISEEKYNEKTSWIIENSIKYLEEK
ncbi:MAG: hypothetical protein ACQESB_00085 [Elusimicrobiota bacterium]